MLNEKNKPRPWYYYITYLWCIYVDLFFWFWVGVVLCAIWGTKRHWTAGCLCIEFQEGSWPMRSWYRGWLGTTLGHTIIYSPGKSGEPGIVDTHTERHEMIHVHQFETVQLLMFIIAGFYLYFGFEWYKLLILPYGSLLAYAASMLQAALRGEVLYKENIFEEHAYAADDE